MYCSKRLPDRARALASSSPICCNGRIRLSCSILSARTMKSRRVSAARAAKRLCCSTLRTEKAAQRSEEHTSELQSLMRISYAVFCLKKKKQYNQHTTTCRKQHRDNQPILH